MPGKILLSIVKQRCIKSKNCECLHLNEDVTVSHLCHICINVSLLVGYFTRCLFFFWRHCWPGSSEVLNYGRGWAGCPECTPYLYSTSLCLSSGWLVKIPAPNLRLWTYNAESDDDISQWHYLDPNWDGDCCWPIDDVGVHDLHQANLEGHISCLLLTGLPRDCNTGCVVRVH